MVEKFDFFKIRPSLTTPTEGLKTIKKSETRIKQFLI